jgi:DNA-binding transcriptional LysR family regulator
MISLEALQAIDSIERKGSFSAAAEELFKVPSAVTYTVKKLENQLNIKIFDRSAQRARLTPTGKLILQQGREILHKARQLEEHAKRTETGWETELRVVVDTLLPIQRLYTCVQSLQEQFDWMSIQLMEGALSGTWEKLITQDADLIIGVTGDEPPGGHFQKQVLGQMQMDIYCGTNHPASRLSKPVQYSQLERFVHIVISDSARHLSHRNVGMLGLKQILAVPNMTKKTEALIANLGISHLPHYIGEAGVKAGSLKKLVFDTGSFPHTLFMVWPKANTGKANDWLRAEIIEKQVFQACLI